jgi:hypothetical protein
MGDLRFLRGSRLGAIALLICLAFTAGCSHPPRVIYQYDSKTDFSTFKTYSVEPTNSPTLDLRILDSKPMTQTVQDSIERQLDARGLRKVESGSADLHVRWAAQIEQSAASGDVAAPGVNLGLDSPDSGAVLDSGPPGGEGIPAEITKGGVRVDLIDARTGKTVWRGGAAAILKPHLPDPERVKILNAALAKLFANYPPKPAAAP